MRKERRLFSIYFPICPVLYHQWLFKENLIQNTDVKTDSLYFQTECTVHS